MSILRDHFEKVRRMTAQGLPLTNGVYVDVGNTLITRRLNQPLVDFLQWNNTHKLLGENHIFTSDLAHSRELIAREGFDPRSVGVDQIMPKKATYNAAFNHQHAHNIARVKAMGAEEKSAFVGQPAFCLELVIDDYPLGKAGIKGAAMVLSTWDPHEAAVEKFLNEKAYLAFTPQRRTP